MGKRRLILPPFPSLRRACVRARCRERASERASERGLSPCLPRGFMKRGKYFPHPARPLARLGDKKKEGIEVDHRRRRRLLLRWRRGYGCRRRGNEAGELRRERERKASWREKGKRGRLCRSRGNFSYYSSVTRRIGCSLPLSVPLIPPSVALVVHEATR